MTDIRPTYYVRHPDGTYSIATPQPTDEEIAVQDGKFAQCDREHGGSVCGDPDCHRAVPVAAEQIDAAARKLAEVFDYPWEHMPEQGRATMRNNAIAVIGAALAAC